MHGSQSPNHNSNSQVFLHTMPIETPVGPQSLRKKERNLSGNGRMNLFSSVVPGQPPIKATVMYTEDYLMKQELHDLLQIIKEQVDELMGSTGAAMTSVQLVGIGDHANVLVGFDQ